MTGKAAQLTRGFSGIAVGMATSYAANYVTNPNARAGLEYSGSAITGAVGGAMMGGPVGAAIGALAGLLKTYMDKQGERSAMSKDFEKGEEIYAATYRDNQKFRQLSSTKKGVDLGANLAEVKQMLDNYAESAAKFVDRIRAELKNANPDKEKLEKLQRNLGYSRSQIARYESLRDSLEARKEADEKASNRTSTSAFDSLGKVGGYLYGGGMAPEDASSAAPSQSPRSRLKPFSGFSVAVTKTQDISFGGPSPTADIADEVAQSIRKEQLATLEDILKTLKEKGGATWQ